MEVAVIISNALVMGVSTDVDSESTAWDVTEVDPWQRKTLGIFGVSSGKHTKNYGKSAFLMGKSTINHHFQ